MKTRLLILCTSVSIALLFSSCQQPTGPDDSGTPKTSYVTGFVRGSISGGPSATISGAIVSDTKLASVFDTSKSDGSFRLTYQLTSRYSGSIIATLSTWRADTVNVSLDPGATDSLVTLTLKGDSASKKASVLGKVASLVLISSGDVSNLSVRGTGTTESSLLTFEARDSVGDVTSGTLVNFSILGGPGGGEFLFPVSGKTDNIGKVTTRVTAGTKAGVLQVQAVARPDTTGTIVRSSPVRLTISGGLPDSAHFSLNVSKYNIAGLLYDNLRTTIGVIVGDKDGNPVQQGTAVYFTTTGGLVQPSAVTNKDGQATVDLISANPRPAGGVVVVTAKTIGDSGKIISKKGNIVFSGVTQITHPANGFVIQDSSYYDFNYTVSDAIGNPIIGKSTVTVSVSGPGSGDLEVLGDGAVTIPDAPSGGLGITQFSVRLRDKSMGGAGGPVNVLITVKSDDATGNGSTASSFSGRTVSTTAGGGGFGGGGSGLISNLTLSSINPASGSLSVKGTGSNEAARLTFIAKDSVGNPVADPFNPSKKVYVEFSYSPVLGAGEFLFPASDSTDLQGHVGTTFNAGTRSGVFQVTATAKSGSGAVLAKAAPVVITISGGFPDINAFSPTISKVNLPGLVKTGALGTVNVQVGDSAGNPVQQGTKIYFSTTGGLITAQGITNQDGQASATLQGGSPSPNNGGPGRGLVTVQTVGKGGVSISKQIPFLFSGSPIIAGPVAGFQIADSGSYFFKFQVADLNGNPMVSGTKITVTKDGPGSSDLELKGNADVTMPDTKDTSFTNFSVQVQDKSSGGASGEVEFKISVAGDNGVAQYTWKGTQLAKGVSPVGASNGYASSIEVFAKNSSTISVKGTGNAETATIAWLAKDSLGNPISLQRSVPVKFTLLTSPGGGEFLFPDSAVTDASGKVATTLNSGTKAGVIQVVATIVGTSIQSSPAALVISGGLPDSNNITITLSKQNMPGLVKSGRLGTVDVQMGDKYRNPVPSGTAVYFTTEGGVIDASAVTTNSGTVSASISGGNPAPINPSPGLGFITMETGGVGGKITKKVPFLFSGAPKITAPASGFQIADSGQYNFTFKVADANGNPLSSGTVITVTKDGPGSTDLDVKGDVSKTMPDTKDTSATNFSVQVFDKTKGGSSGLITLTISVTGDNGTASYNWTGNQLASGVAVGGASPGYPGSILIQNVNPAAPGPISVKGTGSSETAVMTFLVKDSLGNALDFSRASSTTVTFTIQNGPGGGEYLSPTSATPNQQGTVTTTLGAGTKAGVIQVIAQTVVNAVIVKSSPVQMTIASGLADVGHFTFYSNGVNSPITQWNSGQGVNIFSVLVGDKYGNPAQGTAVYFTSNGGVIDASATTDKNGAATNIVLKAGNPFPAGGIDTVTAITQGDAGQILKRIILTVSSDAAISAPASLPTVTDGGFVYLNFDVKDSNLNPGAAGNVITVTLGGDAAGQLNLSGNSNVTTVDTRDTSTVHYQVKIADATPNGGTGGNFTAVIKVVGPNTSTSGVSKTVTGFLQAPGVVVGGGGGGTGYTSSIVLSSVSATDISVKGTGSSETATLVFQAKDSLGQTVDQTHGSMMHFTISFPTLGATLTIDSIQTDASGRATTLVNSGIVSGVIQVRATTTTPNGQTIGSLPVRLSINSGLPDQAHFTVGAGQLNFPGLDQNSTPTNNLYDVITVQMGDKYGNPVQKGTVAYFTSANGVVQTVSSTTDASGFIQQKLFAGNPRPEGSGLHPGLTSGFSRVYASTQGQNGLLVSDSVLILWTGRPIITNTGISGSQSILHNNSLSGFSFTVVDRLGNPLCAGTKIGITCAGAIVAPSGEITLPDTQAPGSGITSFPFTLKDGDGGSAPSPIPVSPLVITVTHPIYGIYSVTIAQVTIN